MKHKQAWSHHRDRPLERGAGLVLIIGVVAALAISAAVLVAFTGNIQHNTADTRTHVKSFGVCEGALDAGMAMLSRQWPVSDSAIPIFDADAFRDQFDEAEFPRPQSGDFINLDWYDNDDPVSGERWDQNGDGMLWMVAQANVGNRSTRVMSLVQRRWLTMSLPRGIPLWAGGDLLSNGQGNNPKIRIEIPPPPNEAGEVLVTVHVTGVIEESDVTQDGVTQKTGAEVSPLEEVFPQALVDSLTNTAQANGRYFTSLAAAETSGSDAVWSPSGGLSGLTVIAPEVPTTIKVTGNIVLNSEDQPGILMILGGSTLVWGGTGQFYGVIYSEGPMDTSNGTADIHGMVITNNTEDMRGTPNILYNDNCIVNLNERFPSLVRRVQNSWRELQPLQL